MGMKDTTMEDIITLTNELDEGVFDSEETEIDDGFVHDECDSVRLEVDEVKDLATTLARCSDKQASENLEKLGEVLGLSSYDKDKIQERENMQRELLEYFGVAKDLEEQEGRIALQLIFYVYVGKRYPVNLFFKNMNSGVSGEREALEGLWDKYKTLEDMYNNREKIREIFNSCLCVYSRGSVGTLTKLKRFSKYIEKYGYESIYCLGTCMDSEMDITEQVYEEISKLALVSVMEGDTEFIYKDLEIHELYKQEYDEESDIRIKRRERESIGALYYDTVRDGSVAWSKSIGNIYHSVYLGKSESTPDSNGVITVERRLKNKLMGKPDTIGLQGIEGVDLLLDLDSKQVFIFSEDIIDVSLEYNKEYALYKMAVNIETPLGTQQIVSLFYNEEELKMRLE